MRHDRVQTLNTMLDMLDLSALNKAVEEIVIEAEGLLDGANVAFEGIERLVEFDMLYLGQTHTVSVPVPDAMTGCRSELDTVKIKAAFETAYKATFGSLLDGIGIRVMNLRVAVIGTRPKFDLALLAPSEGGSVEASRTGARQIWFDGKWWDSPVYDRLSLPVGAEVPGPAVLEQADTTILVDPDLTGTVDSYGNFVIARKA